MFHSLRLYIFIYYFTSVAIFLGVLHFFLEIIEIQNTLILAIIMLGFVSYFAIFISKISIDPLEEYAQNIQTLSNETLHELNLPISSIKTNTQMIKKTLTDSKSLKRLERIELACSMLESRYNELDYMIKTQTIYEMNEHFDIKKLLQQRIEFLSALYPQVKFQVDSESTLVYNDEIGLSKVIDNLIDNAVKYSQKNTILSIKLKNHTLSIQDYGKGMDEMQLLHIFDSYYQSDTSMQGFGIGLSLVKRFCDKQKIQLKIESKKDFGTKIILQFIKEIK